MLTQIRLKELFTYDNAIDAHHAYVTAKRLIYIGNTL